jgi:hypothetical protein
MSRVFPHQVVAYESLRRTAQAFLQGDWKRLPLRPRFHRLVVGPSGTGKSHVVRQIAADLKLPCLELSATDWMPLGTSDRGTRPSWLDVADFCHTNPAGVIFVDEIDKCGDRSPWMTHLRVEIFGLLDLRFPENLSWPSRDEEDREEDRAKCRSVARDRLQNDVFIVGAGAFQDLWHAQRPAAGFHSKGASTFDDSLAHKVLAEVIPIEILNRFVPPVIVIPPLVDQDYRALLAAVCRTFPRGRRAKIRALGLQSIGEALSQQLGARWAERLMLEMVTTGRNAARTKAAQEGQNKPSEEQVGGTLRSPR